VRHALYQLNYRVMVLQGSLMHQAAKNHLDLLQESMKSAGAGRL
jgi:hypothetical protein